MVLSKLNFPIDKLKLTNLFSNKKELNDIYKKSEFKNTPQKIKKIYGELFFPKPANSRPYIFTSFVFSMDGKIGFPDNPKGPLISKNNIFNPEGGRADFWILNVLRTYSDMIIRGAKTLEVEPNDTGHIFDPDLIKPRQKLLNKNYNYPINLIVSLDGRDIPFNHKIFQSTNIITWINTSPAGVNYIKNNWDSSFEVVKKNDNKNWVNFFEKAKSLSKNIIICTGKGKQTNARELLGILRNGGIKYISVESPSYTWHLLKKNMVDEMFINYSGLYVGGDMTFGLDKPFNSKSHPHSQILKIDIHNDSFIYTRQKMIYDI